ncbi:DUF1127 domain-containing protein [Azospirillum griseum]|uniref:DUF1127 domain-containing protein n=1 Tax=Azospirillum griseum TaxID=2496639 RepID=A0A3S0JLK0_9PROT|nr:DUF1127 domain-containing protein [Azospirillum griseum]RTR23748.1 DUF1127 domain-containing protein [Azospirillum griseum]
MSQSTQSPITLSGSSATRVGGGLGGVVTALFDGLATWADRRRQRRTLTQMPDHLLADIGLSRADAEQEVTKPFWRG